MGNMNKIDTGYKTIDDDIIYEDSKIVHVYGIPPTFATFTICEKEGIYWCHTDDASPNDILLEELVELGVEMSTPEFSAFNCSCE